MKIKILIGALITLAASAICFLLRKWAYRQGGMVMDGDGSYYEKWYRIYGIFGKCGIILLIIAAILLVIFLVCVLRKVKS